MSSPNPKRRPYPPEFRREAVELYRSSGKSIGGLGRELSVSHEAQRQWIKQAGIDARQRPGVTSDEPVELRELRKKVRRLEAERDLLKGAAALFAAETEIR